MKISYSTIRFLFVAAFLATGCGRDSGCSAGWDMGCNKKEEVSTPSPELKKYPLHLPPGSTVQKMSDGTVITVSKPIEVTTIAADGTKTIRQVSPNIFIQTKEEIAADEKKEREAAATAAAKKKEEAKPPTPMP